MTRVYALWIGRDGWLRLLELEPLQRKHFLATASITCGLTGCGKAYGSNRAQSHRCGTSDSDPSAGPRKAVGQGKLSVIFATGSGESLPAFPDLAAGMSAHLKLLHDASRRHGRRCSPANPRGTGSSS